MKLKFFAAISLLLFISSDALAGSKYQYSAIKRYYPATNLLLQVQDTMINPAGCKYGSYYVLEPAHPNFEDYKKIALTAKVSGFKIGIYIYDDQCVGSYPKIYRMFIQ